MQPALVSIIVPTYNRCDLLPDALGSLIRQSADFSYEIVVVDDGSTDTTQQVVETIGAACIRRIRYVRCNQHGYPEALNAGVSAAIGDWIALFDDDERAAPDWLSNLLAVAREYGARIVGGSVQLQGGANGLHPICRGILGEHRHFPAPCACPGKKLPGGGNLLVAKDVFRTIGLFDTTMKGGGCDREFVLRARRSRVPVWYAPDAVIYHRVQPYRHTAEYFRWTSLRQGATLAEIDFKQKRLVWALLLRVGHTALVAIPLCAAGYWSQDRHTILARKTMLWRTSGYLQRALSLLIPGALSFLATNHTFEFRRERHIFHSTTK